MAEDLNGSDHIEEKRLFDCVFMWWDLDMDGTGRNYITMAPTWWDADSKVICAGIFWSYEELKRQIFLFEFYWKIWIIEFEK